MKSGYNHGHWTQHNEQWFQARLRAIRSGEGDDRGRVRNSTQWKSSTRGDVDGHRIFTNCNKLAADFIKGVYGHQ